MKASTAGGAKEDMGGFPGSVGTPEKMQPAREAEECLIRQPIQQWRRFEQATGALHADLPRSYMVKIYLGLYRERLQIMKREERQASRPKLPLADKATAETSPHNQVGPSYTDSSSTEAAVYATGVQGRLATDSVEKHLPLSARRRNIPIALIYQEAEMIRQQAGDHERLFYSLQHRRSHPTKPPLTRHRPMPWRHTIKVHKALPRAPDLKLPLCIGGENACPPEDVGGPWP